MFDLKVGDVVTFEPTPLAFSDSLTKFQVTKVYKRYFEAGGNQWDIRDGSHWGGSKNYHHKTAKMVPWRDEFDRLVLISKCRDLLARIDRDFWQAKSEAEISAFRAVLIPFVGSYKRRA